MNQPLHPLPADQALAALKLPPHSIEAEQAVLGGLLLDEHAFDRVAEIVTEDDFYRRDHRLIFRAIAQLAEENRPRDALTLAETLRHLGLIDEAGGLAYITELVKNTPSAANIKAYAEVVRERSILRQLIKVSNEVAGAAFSPEGRTSMELLDEAESKIFAIAEQQQKEGSGPRLAKDVLKEVLNRMTELHESGAHFTGVSTGFTDLDTMTSGMQKGDLLIVAARPSMGKCIVAGSRLLDSRTGALRRIEDCVASEEAAVLALDNAFRLQEARPSAFVDDGLKPVFRVTTASGRRIETTWVHPFLTGAGWRPLAEIAVGERIAVPRCLPVFGTTTWPEGQVKALAYFIADGGLTQSSPSFTNRNEDILQDFADAVADFPGVICRRIEDGMRTPTLRVVRDGEATAEARAQFAEQLRLRASGLALTQRDIAGVLGVVPSAVHAWWHGRSVPAPDLFEAMCALLCCPPEELCPAGMTASAHNQANAVSAWLTTLGLWGLRAPEKQLPAVVFTLSRPQLALFLSRLFACDGSVYRQNADDASAQYGISYATSSEALARDVQHLLLRFGVLATLRTKRKHYSDTQAVPYELRITHQASVATFLAEIGLFGKETAMAEVLATMQDKRAHSNTDSLPESVCDYVLACKGERSWPEIFAVRGRDCPAGFNPHLSGASRRCLSRARAAEFADLFDDAYLRQLAESDVYWDEIVSMEAQGEKQVYDLTVPERHNFVANDVLVHNTTFAMNLVENAAIRTGQPVLVFSMEMPSSQIMERVIASLGRVELNKIKNPWKMEPEDWPRVTSAMTLLSHNKMLVDDTAALTPVELRARARRVARDHGPLALIMVDYLQLMRVPGAESRVNEISEISRSLKALAKEMTCPVLALSQLNRGVDARTDKRPMMSDLRESGAIEQDADVIMFIYRDEVYNKERSEAKGMAEVIIGKQRNGPIGSVNLAFLGKYTRFEDLAPEYYQREYQE